MLSVDKLQGLDLLAGAVVAQAVRDYESAYKTWLKCGEVTRSLKELRLFFTSPWFEVLVKADGEKTMRLIEKKCIERRRK